MKKPATISESEAIKIINAAEYPYKLIFRLMAETGFRVSDIVGMKWENLDFTTNFIFLDEKKSGKKRIIELSAGLMESIKNYKRYELASNFVFRSRFDSNVHLHRSTVHRVLKRLYERLRICCSAHSFRKLYAQRIFQKTKSIKIVQQALNHSSAKTTLTYLDF